MPFLKKFFDFIKGPRLAGLAAHGRDDVCSHGHSLGVQGHPVRRKELFWISRHNAWSKGTGAVWRVLRRARENKRRFYFPVMESVRRYFCSCSFFNCGNFGTSLFPGFRTFVGICKDKIAPFLEIFKHPSLFITPAILLPFSLQSHDVSTSSIRFSQKQHRPALRVFALLYVQRENRSPSHDFFVRFVGKLFVSRIQSTFTLLRCFCCFRL